MAFKPVLNLDTDTTVSIGGVNRKTGKKNPSSIEGYYLGNRKVDSKKDKKGFTYLYTLQTDKGNVGVWGKTDMDRKLQSISTGCMIRITHSGMKATTNGEMYTYLVEVDESNTIDVPTTLSAAADEESEASSSDDDETTLLEEDEFVAPVAPSANSADRRARVNALLSKNKK